MKRALKIYLEKPELAGILLLVVLMAFFEFRSNGIFLSYQNIRGVLGLLPEVGAVTIGFAMLMICGEFDLSVGSVFAIMPMSIALMLNAGVAFWPAFAVGVLICAIIGFLNAFITLKFDIPSFITTLGMLFMVRSLTIVMSGGFPPLLAVDKIPMGLFTDFHRRRPLSSVVPLVRGARSARLGGHGEDELRQLDQRRLAASSRRRDRWAFP